MSHARLQDMLAAGETSPAATQELIDCRTENEHLDYKVEIELDSPKGMCGFARDVLAFRNVGGGYLVIGLDKN